MNRFSSLLIANRGEIACRIATTARALGLRVIAVHSQSDAGASHVRMADMAVEIGGAGPGESYLDIERILAAARSTGAQAIHPGYGFLAENARFATAVLEAGLVWVGPSPEAMHAMGDKARAKGLARAIGVPVLPGYDAEDQSDLAFAARAADIGYPLLVKAAAGGGGRGMRRVRDAAQLADSLISARIEAHAAFGDGRLLLERALDDARHIEVQVFGDEHGECIHLGERECSIQRRHQKIIEESPAPNLAAESRAKMCTDAVALARHVGYRSAGTVEFLVDATGRHYFMEMNTRLQVEHPVTEMITGIDLVEWQLRVAAGERLPMRQDAITFQGHAIEARLCAEDVAHGFAPQSGTIEAWRPPQGITSFAARPPGQAKPFLRLDAAVFEGIPIPPHYDAMLGKFIGFGATRQEARASLVASLEQTVLLGIPTNKALLVSILRNEAFASARIDIGFLERDLDALKGARRFDEAAALATVLYCLDEARHAGFGAGFRAGLGAGAGPGLGAGFGEWAFWSNNSAHAACLALEIDGSLRLARIRRFADRFTVEIDEEWFELRITAHDEQGAFMTIADGPSTHVPYKRRDNVLHLEHQGESYRVDDVRAVAVARRRPAATDGRLLSPMSAQVAVVDVRPGDTVAADTRLLALAAMKMEHSISAPAALKVTAVHVAPADVVAIGQVLLEFDLISGGLEPSKR